MKIEIFILKCGGGDRLTHRHTKRLTQSANRLVEWKEKLLFAKSAHGTPLNPYVADAGQKLKDIPQIKFKRTPL